MSRRSICLIGGGLSVGGTERALTMLSNNFAELGYDVSIITCYKTSIFFDMNPNIRIFMPKRKRGKSSRVIYIFSTILFVHRTIKKIKPDTILTLNDWINLLVVIANIGTNIPIYVSERISPTRELGFIFKLLKPVLYKYFVDGVIVQTNTAYKILFSKIGLENIKVIPNPANCIERINCERKNTIVTVGRLSKEKGHRYLVEAFAKIDDKSWELGIVGDGDEREDLVKLANYLGVSDRIIFHGPQKDLSIYLSEAKLFVLPSLSEGFPNALIEAMSLPLPCISSNCIAGPSDIIEDGVNGFLVEPGNVEALASALNRLIYDANLRNKLASEAYKIRETLAWDKIFPKYIDFVI